MTISDPTLTPAAVPPRNWWQLNWKWVVPVGCGSLVVFLAVLIAAIMLLVFSVIRSTDVFHEALERAKADPQVRTELGEPIEPGWWVSGNVESTGSSGRADIAIPLKGSRQSGTLYAVAHKSAGRWTYQTLEVEVKGREGRINLLANADSF